LPCYVVFVKCHMGLIQKCMLEKHILKFSCYAEA